MAFKFSIAWLAIFTLLTLLRFVEDSPIRSWKGVLFIGVTLSILTCWWIKWAFPPPPPPQSRAERVDLNRAELQRTIRRIEGVDKASINGSVIEINFSTPKPINDIRRVVQQVGGTAGYFLKHGSTNHITIRVSVQGLARYRVEYDENKGFINEEEF